MRSLSPPFLRAVRRRRSFSVAFVALGGGSDAMATFYRIVKTNPPTVADFLTDRQARRRPPPLEVLRLWGGRSVFDSEAIAREVAQRFPVIGSYIAVLDIPEGGTIIAERTLRRPGHYTLWGDAAAILERVVAVVSV